MPIVVTGFEPLDLLEGILYAGRDSSKAVVPNVENQYTRAVQKAGNRQAQERVLTRCLK